MIFSATLAHIRAILVKRSTYAQLVIEIEGMSQRDLADMRADRAELLFQAYVQAYVQVYG